MSKLKYFLLAFSLIVFYLSSKSQQKTKQQLLFLTPEWKGERFPDGRPKVSDSILSPIKLVTLEEAWAVLRNENYKHQYDDGKQ